MATSILQWMTSFVTGRNGAGAQSSRDDENRKRVADLAQVGQQVAAELRQVRTYNDVVRKQLELVVSETEKAAFDITSRLQTIDEVVGQLNHFVTTTSNESSEFLAVSEDRLKHNRSLVDALERYIHERIGTAESDQKRVAQVEQDATQLFNRHGLADGNHRNVDGHLLLEVDQEQVDVDRATRDRVFLDRLQQDWLRSARAGDVQVEHRVAAGVAVEELKLVQIERDRLRCVALAIDNAGQTAISPELGNFLAKHGARLCGQLWSCHGRPDPNTVVRLGLWRPQF